MDIQVDSTTGDLKFVAGDLNLIDGAEAIAQNLRIRLRFFQGEWFADTRIGLPYYQSILAQKTNPSILQGFFTDAILKTPGVLSIQNLNLDFDGVTRRLSLSFEATISDSATPLVFTDEFIIVPI